MNDYLKRKLKNRDYFDKPTTTVFEKAPFIKCYNVEGNTPNEVFVTFKLGAIAKLSNGSYDIIYAEEASDGCSYFGGQAPDRKKYVFEIEHLKHFLNYPQIKINHIQQMSTIMEYI